jgi:hypothetical protein
MTTVRFPLALVSAVCLMLFAATCGGGATTIRIGVIATARGGLSRFGGSRPLARRIVGNMPWKQRHSSTSQSWSGS